jgi:putative glutamine amidotransferase
MAKPIILVTAGRQRRAAARSEIQTVNTGVDIDYIDSLVAAGGAPVILPCMPDKAAIASAVDAADGILLTGGGDVMSLAYGEEPHPSCMYQDPVRDEMEIEVVRLALNRKIPILGICRGLQLLNVALGGTLVQDVVSQVQGVVKHYAHGLTPVLMHSVDIAEGSLLAQVFGRETLPVNSYHHQSAKDVGKGLRANCWARDGVVEGLEAADGRPILAVQFHPEEIALEHPEFLALFQWLVRESSAAKLPKAATTEKPALVRAYNCA